MVFYISVLIVIALVLWGSITPTGLTATANQLLNFTTSMFGWFFLIVTFAFLVFTLYLAFSRFGNIKLGNDDDEPMLFWKTKNIKHEKVLCKRKLQCKIFRKASIII